jgi:hypothetical protein
METEVFTKTLCLFWFGIIKIEDLPSLVGTIMSVPNDYLSSFLILSSMNIKAFLVLPVDEVLISIGEDLVPLRVSVVDLHVLCSSRVLDVPRFSCVAS